MDTIYEQFDKTGRFRALTCDWVEGMDYTPHKFWDSDVYKWMEGAAYVLAHHQDASLEQKVESLIDQIEAHQWEDGYAHAMNDGELLDACKALWEDIVTRKMYLTGGIGGTHFGEAFAAPCYLPDETAYAETCAAVALALFSQKLWEATGDARYADIIERTLYNGILSGIGLDGKSFFYRNPLRINLQNSDFNRSTTEPARQFPSPLQRPAIFKTSCCPPNIMRLLASVGQYLYGRDGRKLYVNQYAASRWQEGDMAAEQKTAYPACGTVELSVKGIQTLYLRIPGWCKKVTLSVPYITEGGYARIDNPPETVTATFDMSPTIIRANPKFFHYTGKAAVQMGPIVYCAEGVDNPALHSLLLRRDTPFHAEYSEEYSCNILTAEGFLPASTDEAYPVWDENRSPVTIKLIPYFAFANRGESDMAVWMPVI